jgi:hypothetical protein
VKFVVANDATGVSWRSSVRVFSGAQAQHISLVVAAGFPGISFYNLETRTLHFARGIDAFGTNFSAPIRVDPGVDRGRLKRDDDVFFFGFSLG